MIETKEGFKLKDIGKFKKKFDMLMDAPLDISFGEFFEHCTGTLALRNLMVKRSKLSESDRVARTDEMASIIEMMLWGVLKTQMGWEMNDSNVLLFREALIGRTVTDEKMLLETEPNK